MFLLQASHPVVQSTIDRLPTFSDLIGTYGAYLTTIIAAAVAICCLQFWWFNRIMKAKDQQIKRMDEREQEIYNRLLQLLDKLTRP